MTDEPRVSAPLTGGVRLTCVPGRQGDTLVIPYRVENDSPEPIYVVDAIPGVDQANGHAIAGDQFVVVAHIAGEDALVARMPLPLPTDRVMLVQLPPLVRRLEPGQTLARDIRLPSPLAETNPYLPDLLLRQYDAILLASITFAVAWWQAGTPGLLAGPVPYAPDHLLVQTDKPPSFARQRFPVRNLQLFRRKDAFPRNFASPGQM